MSSVDRHAGREALAPSPRVTLELHILDARHTQRPSARLSVRAADSADAADGGALVLVVAGDDDVRSYLHQHLRDYGLRVIAATGVRQALECLTSEAPRVIVVDAPEASLLTLMPPATSLVLADALPHRPAPKDGGPDADVAESGPPEWVLMPWPFEVQTFVHEVARLAA